MKKVLVIGCPGAGKSTFARALQKKTGLPLYYLDMLYHRPDKTTLSQEDFDTALACILQKECFIIDGNYGRTLDLRLSAADTVFFLDYDKVLCLASVRARIGKRREDMPWIETVLDDEFLLLVEEFPKKQRPRILALLDKYKASCHIHIFKNRLEADDYLEKG